ncbi:unnamed protein product [Nesidiocoris tenuis]|uniref:Uncharacterized protein n=1 Tax=Nesidiocoris tenuis TaxID=355587 RepID=A0A6H5HE52_9HEMI|nr:unnamed protein product [Nesidiocoris tenuis]
MSGSTEAADSDVTCCGSDGTRFRTIESGRCSCTLSGQPVTTSLEHSSSLLASSELASFAEEARHSRRESGRRKSSRPRGAV